jgi:glycosyltransferase involved in cell wall biosynthesis
MALAELPDAVHLAFVGRFHEGTAKLAKRHGVAERVHTPGAVKPEQVVPYIRSADAAAILYYPVTGNYRNIIPNGFFQSLAAELPLLYPDLPEIMKITAKQPVGREIDPTDSDSLKEGLSWMLENRDELDRFRKNLRVLADEMGWCHEEVRLGQIVERLALK